jgi:hypothetical protein
VRGIIIGLVGLLTLGACSTLPKPSQLGRDINPDPLTLPDDWGTYTGDDANQEIAYALIAASDSRCEDYLVGVSVQRNSANATLSVGSLVLGTVGGLVAPAESANAFAAGSTLLQGTSRTLNDTIFSGRDFALIYDAVRTGRRRQRRMMETAIDAGDWDGLAVNGVLARVRDYDHNCGVTYGLTEINRALADQQREAERPVRDEED